MIYFLLTAELSIHLVLQPGSSPGHNVLQNFRLKVCEGPCIIGMHRFQHTNVHEVDSRHVPKLGGTNDVPFVLRETFFENILE